MKKISKPRRINRIVRGGSLSNDFFENPNVDIDDGLVFQRKEDLSEEEYDGGENGQNSDLFFKDNSFTEGYFESLQKKISLVRKKQNTNGMYHTPSPNHSPKKSKKIIVN
jgi:hypothetical protein